jgi:GDP-4-dehydro-6-deoxy-D-mannose reductase
MPYRLPDNRPLVTVRFQVRVLITGASGFAGGWLARACAQAGDELLGVSRSGDMPAGVETGVALDLTDATALSRLLAEFKPDVVYHLAALSHVGRSWEEPAQTLDQNVTGAVNLLEGVRLTVPQARVVWASSCEVYGNGATLPVTEQAPLQPATPYGVSKAAGDMLAAVYADAHGLKIVRARPFNHTGPGQASNFLISSLAKQAAAAKLAGARQLQIATGNPQTRRDFTDVRDVVRAYRLLADPDVPAGVFNVASSRSISAAENVQVVAELIAPIAVEHVVDPTRVRPHEVMDHRGDFSALKAATGWEPEITIRQTIADAIGWWEAALAG